MIITDGTNTFTTLNEDIQEEVLHNGSVTYTLGGRPKSQADSQRLKITSTIRVSQAEFASINAILINWSAPLEYTPVRQLAYKTSIAQIPVVLIGAPKIKERAWNGTVYFYITLEMEEDPLG
jgi:hypothetical protein